MSAARRVIRKGQIFVNGKNKEWCSGRPFMHPPPLVIIIIIIIIIIMMDGLVF